MTTTTKNQSDKLVLVTKQVNEFAANTFCVCDYPASARSIEEKVYIRFTPTELRYLEEKDCFVTNVEEYFIGSWKRYKVTYETIRTPIREFKTASEANDYTRKNYSKLLRARLSYEKDLEELRKEHAF